MNSCNVCMATIPTLMVTMTMICKSQSCAAYYVSHLRGSVVCTEGRQLAPGMRYFVTCSYRASVHASRRRARRKKTVRGCSYTCLVTRDSLRDRPMSPFAVTLPTVCTRVSVTSSFSVVCVCLQSFQGSQGRAYLFNSV